VTIVIAGEVDFPPENRAAALSGARALIDAALAEPGCRHYAWSADPFDAGRVHVFEEWDDEATLASHFQAAPYRGMLAHLSSYTIVSAVTRKYRVDASEPVYGADGLPSARFGAPA
jgi:quinol monooxygenase YgiN